MNKRSKGFVVSAVLYPLLVLFLALIMGLLAMTDTRKRILDKMKLEISDSIFDEATCSCDTILNKLNYLIKNGVSGGGGGSGSYAQNVLTVNVKKYETPNDIPNVGNSIGDIAVITDHENKAEFNYFVSKTRPSNPKEGDVWVVQDINSPYYIFSDYSRIGINYVMEYVESEWKLRKSYVFDNRDWTMLYYVHLNGTDVDLTNTDINAKIESIYDYTGDVQEFVATFSGYYHVQLWGAQGGTYGGSGGLGAYTEGDIYLDAGTKLYLYVGGAGTGASGSYRAGGYNGGGSIKTGTDSGAGSGGGSTDIRLEKGASWDDFESLKSRIMVAAGGGGGISYADNTAGGSGGGLRGDGGGSNGGGARVYLAQGATQAKGGTTAGGTQNNYTGKIGKGASSPGSYGAGGGGGYFGGGAGGSTSGHVYSASGGSSYISGMPGTSSIDINSTENDVNIVGEQYHYSGYYFLNPVMIDGTGYGWKGNKTVYVSMPKVDGTGMVTGNSGNGHAKITLQTVEILDRETNMDSYKEYHYGWTLSSQTFIAPKTGTYKIELWGAKGGSYGGSGGNGAYTSGEIDLIKGTKLYIYVGKAASGGTGGVYNASSYNGGGRASYGTDGGSGAGGGSTDIRLVKGTSCDDFESLKSRIMVAAGGGGAISYTGNVNGGAGGGLKGYTGASTGGGAARYNAGGGTQIQGGTKAGDNNTRISGSFGLGGDGDYYGGGGGGGYFGGGAGSSTAGRVYSAGGGSSYISGHKGCIAIQESSTPAEITSNSDSIHYSGFSFKNTKMIDGNGYQWTDVHGPSVGQPTPDGNSTQTGNSGSGYAKITYLGE